MLTYKQQIRAERIRRLEFLLALVANEQLKRGWRGGPAAVALRRQWWFRWKAELRKLYAREVQGEAASG